MSEFPAAALQWRGLAFLAMHNSAAPPQDD
jgi:hypothetical protein